jgi:hypothetical protein
MRFGLTVAFLGVLLSSLCIAQAPGFRQPSVIMAPVEDVHVRAGSSTSIEMAFRVGDGFHVNSNKPHSDFLIPTVLKLTPTEQLSVAEVTYPAGQDETFAFAPKDKLSVYSGDFSITTILKASPRAAAGKYPVKGELTFQACDKAACYPPKTLPVQFQVTVEKK